MSVVHQLSSLDVNLPSPLQQLESPLLSEKAVRVFLKRDDLIHPYLSGNKWRKLKYNLIEAERQGKDTLLSFGGAYSNHIHALAAAGKIFNFKTIGIIRGDEPRDLNETLRFAVNQGMTLQFVDRARYREKTSSEFLTELRNKHGDVFIIPEGGSNQFALPGCAEVVEEVQQQLGGQTFSIMTAVGSGGTAAGILSHSAKIPVYGVAVLKGAGFLLEDIQRLLTEKPEKFTFFLDYHFGGYAKTNEVLINFVKDFKQQFGIDIEPIYTGKLMSALFDLIEKDYFEPGSTIVALHTGGLQGYKQ